MTFLHATVRLVMLPTLPTLPIRFPAPDAKPPLVEANLRRRDVPRGTHHTKERRDGYLSLSRASKERVGEVSSVIVALRVTLSWASEVRDLVLKTIKSRRMRRHLGRGPMLH
jgi:hypothetical protein